MSKGSKEIEIHVTVSDGEFDVERTIPITVNHVNRPPVIESSSPEKERIKVYSGGVLRFSIDAEDPDNDNLTYTYEFVFLDKIEGSSKHSRRFVNVGKKKITSVASDGKFNVEKTWGVEVISDKKKKITTKK